MADILKFKKRSLKEKYKGDTLCRNGHYSWEIETEQGIVEVKNSSRWPKS